MPNPLASFVIEDTIPRDYREVGGIALYDEIYSSVLPAVDYDYSLVELGLDTEGIPGAEWSIQVSFRPGQGLCLCCTDPHFDIAISALQDLADNGALFILHDAATPTSCNYDTVMCRGMGLELRHAKIFNTMYAARLLCLESRGLKTLMHRWCGAKGEDYESMLGDIARDKQIAYLREAAKFEYETLPPVVENLSNGTTKTYKPSNMAKIIARILADIDSYKVLSDGELTNPLKRWKAIAHDHDPRIAKALRKQVTDRLGPFPLGSLDDIPRKKAIYYGCMDADFTRRLKPVLEPMVREFVQPQPQAHYHPLDQGNMVLSTFEEIQTTGMPASYSRFTNLVSFIDQEHANYHDELIHTYNAGRPFNPNSDKDVNSLMMRQGLRGTKRTKKTKALSTSKKSIEEFRYTNRAVNLVFLCREHSKLKSTFCDPVIDAAEDKLPSSPDGDHFTVNSIFDPIKVVSRRPASKSPNLLNQPSRTKIGRMVRDCYETTPDEVFGAWDFKAQELRIAAHDSQDELLCKLFCTCRWCGTALPTSPGNLRCRKSPTNKHESMDPHEATGVRVFGMSPSDPNFSDKARKPAKTATFGILNGLSGPGLLDQFRMNIPPNPDGSHPWADVNDCERLIKEILREVYPGLSRAISRATEEIRRTGMIRDLGGVARYLPEIYSTNQSERSAAVREGYNMRIQGTGQFLTQSVQCYLKPVIRSLQEGGIPVKWRLQVYDELLFSFPEWAWPVMDEVVTDAIVNHHGFDLRVPIEADSHMGRLWGGLK